MAPERDLVLFLAVALVGSVSAQTCEFGSVAIDVGETVCNHTSEMQYVCTSDGNLLLVEEQACSSSSQHCAQVHMDGRVKTLAVKHTACLNGTVTQCASRYHRFTYTVKRFREPMRRRGGRRQYRIVRKTKYMQVNYLRFVNRTCDPEGCIVPLKSLSGSDDPVSVLELNASRCDEGVERMCEPSFKLTFKDYCACVTFSSNYHYGYNKPDILLPGETQCDRKIGEQSICHFDADHGNYTLQANGTCDVQCFANGNYLPVNGSFCTRGHRLVCQSTSKFVDDGECLCEFNSTTYRPYERWCYEGQGYVCAGNGEPFETTCRCLHSRRLRTVGSTWCASSVEYTCNSNGTVMETGEPCSAMCWHGGKRRSSGRCDGRGSGRRGFRRRG